MCSHILSPAHTVMWIQHLHILSCGYKTCTHCHVDTSPAHTVMWIQYLHSGKKRIAEQSANACTHSLDLDIETLAFASPEHRTTM